MCNSLAAAIIKGTQKIKYFIVQFYWRVQKVCILWSKNNFKLCKSEDNKDLQ